MIENGKKYIVDDFVKTCAARKLYYKYTRYRREYHETDESFVFHDELPALLNSIDSEMERHCWDDWAISWKRSGVSLKVTIKAIYSTMWLAISVATEEQMNAVEALIQTKKDWKESDCECEECETNRNYNCQECNCCLSCCDSESHSKSDSE